jgi:hypothetical protein
MLNSFNICAFRGTLGMKIRGHGNPDNNLESTCIFTKNHSEYLLIDRMFIVGFEVLTAAIMNNFLL